METLSFLLCFLSYIIFSETATFEKPLRASCYFEQPWACLTTPYEKFSLEFFPILTVCLHAKNQCDPVIQTGGICDQRIL